MKSILLSCSLLLTALAFGQTAQHTVMSGTKASLATSFDTLEGVKFRIDVSSTPFRFAQNVTGSLLYSTDGEVPTKTPDKAVLVVANSLGTVAPNNRRQFSIERLKKLPRGSAIQVKTINPITVDRLSGYEITGEGKDSGGNKQLVYQAMLFDAQGGYYLLVGTAIQNFDAYLVHYRTIVQTFRAK